MPSKKSEISPLLSMLRSNAFVLPVLLALWFVGRVVENKEWVNEYHAHIVMLIGINITLAVSLQLINGISGQFSLGHAGFMAVGAYLAGYATKTYGMVETADAMVDFANPAAMVLYYLSLGIILAIAGFILYGLFMLIRQSKILHTALPGILMLAVLAWFVADVSAAYHAENPPKYLVWYQSISLLTGGFQWMIDHGTSITSVISGLIYPPLLKPTCLIIALLGGGIFAAATGLIVGLPTLRLRGDYLAIATLGFAEIIRVVITNSEPLGRATGLSVSAYAPPPDEGMPQSYIFPWIYGVAFITTLCIWRLMRSPQGRAIIAVREDDIAAAATGINTTHHKVIAFIVGAFFAGMAGGLFAHLDGYLNPSSFSLMRSIELVVIVTLGGLGNIWGAIIAAIILTSLPELMRQQNDLPEYLRNISTTVAEWRMVIYSLLLIILMIARSKPIPWRRIFSPFIAARPAGANQN